MGEIKLPDHLVFGLDIGIIGCFHLVLRAVDRGVQALIQTGFEAVVGVLGGLNLLIAALGGQVQIDLLRGDLVADAVIIQLCQKVSFLYLVSHFHMDGHDRIGDRGIDAVAVGAFYDTRGRNGVLQIGVLQNGGVHQIQLRCILLVTQKPGQQQHGCSDKDNGTDDQRPLAKTFGFRKEFSLGLFDSGLVLHGRASRKSCVYHLNI